MPGYSAPASARTGGCREQTKRTSQGPGYYDKGTIGGLRNGYKPVDLSKRGVKKERGGGGGSSLRQIPVLPQSKPPLQGIM